MQNYEIYQVVALSIIALAAVYTTVIRPYLVSKTNIAAEIFAIIDYACESGVGFAEQLYKTYRIDNRKELAMNFAFDLLEAVNIFPEQYCAIIEGIIEDKVRQLPRTHTVM